MVDDHRPFWVGLSESILFSSERKNQIMESKLESELLSRAEISSSESVIVKPDSGIMWLPVRDTPEWVLLEDCWEAFLNKKHEDAVRLLPLVERKYIIETVFDRSSLGFDDRVNFFHFSVTAGWVDVAKDLVTNYNFDPKDCYKIWIHGRTLLYHATVKNHVDVVKYLIGECKCDPMTTNEYGDNNVLHRAATNGLLDVLKCAINNHQCNLEATDVFGQTVLLCASEHIDIVKYLINECNCDPNATDRDGDTILHIAAYRGSLDVLKWVINHYQCNLEVTNNSGQIVLHCAIKHVDVVRFLINECNCDPMATDRYGNTVLHIAAAHGPLDVLKWVINHHQCNLEATNKKHQTVLHCAIKRTNVVRFLINECNCDPMATDKDGNTILHKAATNGSLDVLKCAINHHQCNLDATNEEHQTVLHCAVQHISHYVKIYRWSGSHHPCDINTATEWDETILHCPAEHLAIVEFLINECNADPLTFLHIAAKENLLAFMKYLIKYHYCDPTADRTILHCAIEHTDVVRFLINECNCDPMATDDYGNTVLHKVATNGSLIDVLKYAINHHQCNLEATNKNHETVLHCAIKHTNYDVVRFLMNECNCDPNATDKNGDTILHIAAAHGSLDVLKWAINHYQCNLEATNKRHQTVLHCCAIKHTNVIRFLINECNCDPMATDDYFGDTVLHKAARFGSLDVLKCAINHHQCNLEATNKNHQTVLHCAIKHVDVVRFLINECNCDPMATDISGQTPLHLAVSFMCLEAVEYLLFIGKCDPVAKDDKGRTPLEMAKGNKTFKIRDLFEKYSDIAISHPVDSYVNVLLLGNPGAGKSTLSQVIIDTATGSITLGSFKNVRGVKDCTAGIIPTKLKHKTVGNIILHDFAGHSEYYSSHGAVIENLLQGSGGVFLIVINILEKEAVKQLHQWLTIVKIEEQKACDQCYVMVVVSHKDAIIINPFERKRRMEQILAITREGRYDAVFLDCRKLGGSSYDSFLNEVSSSCASIRSTRGRNLSLYCHMMYGLLEKRNDLRTYMHVCRKKNVWNLSGLMSVAKCNKSYILPKKREEFLYVLDLLDSTGLISVLKSEDKVWIVVNKGILLSELNGKLFAPKTFEEHIDIASNTGIVRVSDLTRLFPDYDPDMLICFLKNMELCQEMQHPSFLKVTNLDQLTIEGGETGERLLFFPCLLYSDDRPDVVTREMYKFGWCLQCIGKYHFFPPRYFHVLSLHLAFKYALPQKDCELNRRCTFWRNGLYWFNGRGVGVLVEIVDESQCVLVLMSCEEGYSDNMVRLRRQVIGEVVNVYKKSCSSLDVEELVIDPEKLSYPLKMPRKKIGYGAIKLMLEISNKQDYWVDETGTKHKKLKSILTDESLSDISNISILGGRDIKVKLRCTIT